MQVVFDLGSIITVFMVNVMDDFGHTVSLFKYVYRSNSNLNKIWQKISIFQESGFCFRETTNDAINPDWDCTFQKDDTPIRQNSRQNESGARNSRQIESPPVEIPGSFITDEYESHDEDVIVDCDEKEKIIKIRKPKSERRQMSKRYVQIFTITDF